MSRGSTHELPCSATSPRRTNAVVNFAPAAAKRRSHMRAAHRPMPAQAPLIAAMIGFGIVVGNQMGLSRPTAPGSSESPPPWRLSMSAPRSEEHTSELQSRPHLVCRLLLEKKTPYHPFPV